MRKEPSGVRNVSRWQRGGTKWEVERSATTKVAGRLDFGASVSGSIHLDLGEGGQTQAVF